MIKTPIIQGISIDLTYPKYIRKKNETISNTGNILVPEGTLLSWKVKTQHTDSVSFLHNNKKRFFKKENNDRFTYSTRALLPINYQIATSNNELVSYEKLSFTVDIIKDEFPKIQVLSEIDSINNTAQFVGKISDDYGLANLEVVYYDAENPSNKRVKKININSENNQTFYYLFFHGELELQKGIDYEVYFQVYDNDQVNGKKKSKSKIVGFRNKSETEIEEEAVQQQRKQIKSIENTLQKKQEQKKNLEEIKQNLQNKKNVNWNDKKKIEDYIKRQEQYKQMMQRQTDKLKENIKDLPSDSESIQQKKEELKKENRRVKKN